MKSRPRGNRWKLLKTEKNSVTECYRNRLSMRNMKKNILWNNKVKGAVTEGKKIPITR